MRLKHTAVAVIGLLFMVSGATAVVGGPEPGENEMAITSNPGSSSSASASKGVSPNGTEWSAETSMANRSGNITDGRLEDISYSDQEYRVEFTGYIQAPTPCHVINHEVYEDGSDYTLNVKTVHDELDEDSNESERVCAQQLTMIEYDGSFSSPEDFTLEVRHNNETVNTLEHPGLEQVDPVEEPKTGFFQSLRNFFSGLF
ncbi:MAG: hypothetical protein ACI9SF_000779 [Candidatus Nanohaloarchaea archaeon]|jgi:hypothetical protein